MVRTRFALALACAVSFCVNLAHTMAGWPFGPTAATVMSGFTTATAFAAFFWLITVE